VRHSLCALVAVATLAAGCGRNDDTDAGNDSYKSQAHDVAGVAPRANGSTAPDTTVDARKMKRKRLERMQEALQLTPDQTRKIEQILESNGSNRQVNQVLTAEQRRTWDTYKERRKSMRKEQPDWVDRMTVALDLSEEQIARMREIKAQGGKRKEMRRVLTPPQLAKLKELRKEAKVGEAEGAKSTDL